MVRSLRLMVVGEGRENQGQSLALSPQFRISQAQQRGRSCRTDLRKTKVMQASEKRLPTKLCVLPRAMMMRYSSNHSRRSMLVSFEKGFDKTSMTPTFFCASALSALQ